MSAGLRVVQPDLRQRIMDFVKRASTELTTHHEANLSDIARILPRGTTVYVAHTPSSTLEKVVRISVKLQSLGLQAVPHFVARRLPGANTLRAELSAVGAAGIRRVLLVAGDGDTSAGPYSNCQQILDSGLLESAGIREVGVAGHPEGLARVASADLWQALRNKQEFARRTGITVYIVTQFSFDAPLLCEWVRALRTQHIKLPVHAGICGPISTGMLVKFAMMCGVRALTSSATRNMRLLRQVGAGLATPEDMVVALVKGIAASNLTQVVQPHFFTFDNPVECARWVRAVAAGEFELATVS